MTTLTTTAQMTSIYAASSLRLSNGTLQGRKILNDRLDEFEEEIGSVPDDWTVEDLKDSAVLNAIEIKFGIILTELGSFVIRHTTASDSYDWHCTSTIERYTFGGREWRKVLIRLPEGNAQCDRYASGACAVNTQDPREVNRIAREKTEALRKQAADEREAAAQDYIRLSAMTDEELRTEIDQRGEKGCSIPDGYARPIHILKMREYKARKKEAIARFEEMRAAVAVGTVLLIPEFHCDRVHRPECVIIVESASTFTAEINGELRDPADALVSCWSPDWRSVAPTLGFYHRGGEFGHIPIGLLYARLDNKWNNPPPRDVMQAVSRAGGKFAGLRRFEIHDEVVWVTTEAHGYEAIAIRQSSARRLRGAIEKEAWALWREAERAVVGQSMAKVGVGSSAQPATSEPAKQSAQSTVPDARTGAQPTDKPASEAKPAAKSVKK